MLICTSWPGARVGQGEATAQAKEATWGASQVAPRAGRLSAPASVNRAEQGLREVARVPRPRPPAPQSLLPSTSSSEKQCPEGGKTSRHEERQTQSLERTFSQTPSAPSYPLETEPLFVDIPLAERLCVLEVTHYRARANSTQPHCLCSVPPTCQLLPTSGPLSMLHPLPAMTHLLPGVPEG